MYFVNMYLTKTSSLIKQFYRDYIWSIDTKNKELFLTFDDGPHPEITPWVLDQLAAFDAKATFFLIGQHAKQYPELVQRILDEGHAIGNHTYSHANGWDVANTEYWRNVLACNPHYNTTLFRPPYGKIRRSQAKALRKRYKIVMWDVLSWDFQEDITPEQCLSNVADHAEKGSIVVFHDSEKAYPNMSYALPKVLEKFTNEGFGFSPLSFG